MKAKEKEGILGRRFYEDELYELDRFELFVEEQVPDDDDDDDDANNNHGSDGVSQNVDDEMRGDDGNEQNRLIRTSQNGDVTCLNEEELTAAEKFKNALNYTKRTFLTITDNIIAAGFAIPRSVSVSTQSLTGKPKGGPLQKNNYTQEVVPEFNPEMFRQRDANDNDNDDDNATESPSVNNVGSMSTSNHNNRRRNVYVYSRQEVVLDVSSDY